MYAARTDGAISVPGINTAEIAPALLRQEVAFETTEPAGTIIVDPAARFLYLVQGGGTATRYGIGVGRAGYNFRGRATVGRKAEWPSWTPTANMIAERPHLYRQWAGGMSGGLQNPLGARALYLYRGGGDTFYRIHGTNEPQSVGRSVSSGCIRMFNQDVIDLYERVPVGAPVVVR